MRHNAVKGGDIHATRFATREVGMLKETLEVLPLDQVYTELVRVDREAGLCCCETRKRYLAYHAMIVDIIKRRTGTTPAESTNA
jgi:hypothetical protein